jgi:DNA-binding NtrC family response regulator
MQNAPIRVLIVNGAPLRDDELSSILAGAGFETRVVSDSESARGSLEIWCPGVAVVDVRMPAGEAYRFSADVAARPEGTPPIVFVGEGSNLLKPTPVIPVGLVPTPIDAEHLVTTVQRAARSAEAAQAGAIA